MIDHSPKSLKNRFKCNVPSASGSRPSSVHALKPQDIEIIAALGDSLTVFLEFINSNSKLNLKK